jgi:predicted extracellular nuclease
MKTKLLIIGLIVGCIHIIVPTRVLASTPPVLISEMSMGSSNSATEEFVEIYNNSDETISLANWSIYYRSATGSTYSKKASFPTTAVIQPRSFFLASTVAPYDTILASGMSQTGGVTELRDDKGNVIDRLGYGNTNLANGKPAAAPQSGESIYREYEVTNKTMLNTNDNLLDFYITSSMSPGSIPTIEIEEYSEAVVYPSIFINELYPNPNPEQSESIDEYIELYNPNDKVVDLNGWLIKDSSGKTFIIKNKIIEPYGYLAQYSSETSIALNNTGDFVELYSPNADLKDQSQDYGDAKKV